MTRMLPLLLVLPLVAQAPAPKADPLAPLRFLEGAWKGEGSGAPGASTGAATFRFELGGRALLRLSHADLPAANGRPASRHEDLMAIFAEGGALKALYLDSEGHVIRYRVEATAEGAVFLNEPAPGPGFRLTYARKGEGRLALRFEIAPPAAPEAFRAYLEADLRRAE